MLGRWFSAAVAVTGSLALAGCKQPAPVSSPGPAYSPTTSAVPAVPPVPAPDSRCSPDRTASAVTVEQALRNVRAVPAKGEFETTAAYQDRLRGLVNLPEDLAIIVPIPEFIPKYDADRQRLTVSYITGGRVLPADSNFGIGGANGSFNYIVAQTSPSRTTGTYIGQNAFGRSATVVRTEVTVHGLSVPNVSTMGWPSGPGRSEITLNLDPDAARVAKSNLAVLFVGAPRPPYLLTGMKVVTPTVQRPLHETTNVRALSMDPVCAVLVNRATREVIRPMPLSNR